MITYYITTTISIVSFFCYYSTTETLYHDTQYINNNWHAYMCDSCSRSVTKETVVNEDGDKQTLQLKDNQR